MSHNNTLHIAILDDHQIIIDGLKLLLQSEPRLKVVLESNNGYHLMQQLETGTYPVDVVLLDLMMPVINGYETALLLNEKFPELKIIVLTMSTQPETAYNLIEKADIKAFLPKSINKQVLLQAIEEVCNGGVFFHDEILKELESYQIKVCSKEALMLSPRELEIIALIVKGMGNKDIATQLYISENTVATHRKNIFRKTQTHNVAQLIELVNRLALLN